MSDDGTLVSAWRSGDAQAGEQLVERHLESVHRFFSNKVAGSTEDLVQRTFLACVESVETFEGRSSFRSYLFGIARHMLYRHYREGQRRFDPLTATANGHLCDIPSPADRVAQREDQRLLLRALRTLPLELQTLVELAYWEGLSDQELAEAMAVPAGTIKSRLRKARAILDDELTRTAGSPALLTSSRGTLDAWAADIRDATGLERSGHRR